MKPAADSKKKAIILGSIIGLLAFWWYFSPFPILGVVVGLIAGFFTYSILSTRKVERLRRTLFLSISALVAVTLTANILYLGFYSFMVWVGIWDTGYFVANQESIGTSPFPIPILIPTILLGQANFLVEGSVWQSIVPTSLDIFFVLMVPYIATFLVFGRAWCGWLCPMGGLPEAMVTGAKERWHFNFLRKKTMLPTGPVYSSLKAWHHWVKYGILTGILILSFVVPFSIVNIISPALWLKSVPVFWTIIGMMILFAVVLPFMTKRRWWCDVICPVGAGLSLIPKISAFRVTIDPAKCTSCMECVRECTMYAMTPEDVEKMESKGGNCVRCGRCIEVCPEEAIDITWLGGRKIRAPFMTLIIGAAVGWYLWFIVLLYSYSTRLSSFAIY